MPEENAEGTAEVFDAPAELAKIVADAQGEEPDLYEQTAEPAAESSNETEENAPESSNEAEVSESEDVAEPEDPAVLQRLAFDRERRTAREEIKRERAEWAAEKAEADERAKLVLQREQFAKSDPVGYLRALGLTDDEIARASEMSAYEALGESAPDSYKAQRIALDANRRIAALEARHAPAPEPTPAAADEAYTNRVHNEIRTLDEEAFPLVSAALKSQGDNGVVKDLNTIFKQHMADTDGIRPSPAGLMRALEKEYDSPEIRAALGLDDEAETPVEQKTAKKSAKKATGRSLRNNQQNSTSGNKKAYADLNYEQQVDRDEKEFLSILSDLE